MNKIKFKNYLIEFKDNLIIVNHKALKVIPNEAYTYKINKNSISAKGGIDGLKELIIETIKENFGTAWVNIICKETVERGINYETR